MNVNQLRELLAPYPPDATVCLAILTDREYQAAVELAPKECIFAGGNGIDKVMTTGFNEAILVSILTDY